MKAKTWMKETGIWRKQKRISRWCAGRINIAGNVSHTKNIYRANEIPIKTLEILRFFIQPSNCTEPGGIAPPDCRAVAIRRSMDWHKCRWKPTYISTTGSLIIKVLKNHSEERTVFSINTAVGMASLLLSVLSPVRQLSCSLPLTTQGHWLHLQWCLTIIMASKHYGWIGIFNHFPPATASVVNIDWEKGDEQRTRRLFDKASRIQVILHLPKLLHNT